MSHQKVCFSLIILPLQPSSFYICQPCCSQSFFFPSNSSTSFPQPFVYFFPPLFPTLLAPPSLIFSYHIPSPNNIIKRAILSLFLALIPPPSPIPPSVMYINASTMLLLLTIPPAPPLPRILLPPLFSSSSVYCEQCLQNEWMVNTSFLSQFFLRHIPVKPIACM